MTEFSRELPHVLIVLNGSYSTTRALLNGILQFSKMHAPWMTDIRLGRNGEQMSVSMSGTAPTGVIVSQSFLPLFEPLLRQHVPIIVDGPLPHALGTVPAEAQGTVPSIVCDNASIAKDAFQHLQTCGFCHYAFIPEPSGQWWSRERQRAFATSLPRKQNVTLSVFDATREGLAQWLSRLPKPVGLFAADDIRARQAADTARLIGARIPDDIAIIGVDNDAILCETATPTLSSVELQTFEAGFRAAELLNDMMKNVRIPPRTARIIRYGGSVIDRQSTHFLATRDLLVSKCRKLLEDNLRNAVSVNDLLSTLRVSRRNLEVRYKSATGHTIHEDLTLMRIGLAKKLLRDSRLPQSQIAESCGFHDASHLNTVFRRVLGTLPSHFRSPSSSHNRGLSPF